MENAIKINDFALVMRAGTPSTFKGKHSMQTLSAIKLEFTLTRPEHIQIIEELFNIDKVKVFDPFVERSYEATLQQSSHSYQIGKPENHYVAEIRELDLPPMVEVLEIEGHTFTVIEYTEKDYEEDVVGRHAILKMSHEQFIDFQNLLKPDVINIKRVGVDEEPILVRYGGAQYWSEHKEGEEVYYKYIVRFFPPNFPSPKHRLEDVHRENLTNMMIRLSLRFEALLKILSQKNIISEELQLSLMGENLEGLIDASRMDELFRELDRVYDASEWLT